MRRSYYIMPLYVICMALALVFGAVAANATVRQDYAPQQYQNAPVYYQQAPVQPQPCPLNFTHQCAAPQYIGASDEFNTIFPLAMGFICVLCIFLAIGSIGNRS